MIPSANDHRLCIAPMMDWTDRHQRMLVRCLSGHARVYTEMLTSGAVIHGDRPRLLGFSEAEHPVALQLGGSEPDAMAQAAAIGAAWGYDEININVGCPSDRVQSGRFGACLMAEPDRVADCVRAMAAAVDVPVTVKCRIGIDEDEGNGRLYRLVDAVAAAGCRTVIVHARKAWLQGLSPKENREVPPLDYSMVHALKADRPDLAVVINGGITDLDQTEDHLAHVDGVMIGRAAYQDPYCLAETDRRLFDPVASIPDRHAAVAAYRGYVAERLADGAPLIALVRPLLGLFNRVRGARAWRRHLSTEAPKRPSDVAVIDEALALIETDPARAAA